MHDKRQKKKKCGQEMSQKKSRRSCTRGSHRKDGSPPPCRTLDGSVQQDFSVSVLLICGARSWMHTGTSSCIHVPSRNNQKRLQAMPNAPSGPKVQFSFLTLIGNSEVKVSITVLEHVKLCLLGNFLPWG